MSPKRIKVAVGLSGGVDSSIAAAFLKEKGHEVTGITMEIFDGAFSIEESQKHACFGPEEKEDVQRAASICEKMDIPFFPIDLRKEYRDHVLDYFRGEYLTGRTPNPCIVCNKRLKFGFLLEKAREAGIDFDAFATGHYARIIMSDRGPLLKQALDLSKDQTYFLWALNRNQLSHALFPLGEFTKGQVREKARDLGLETAERPESQDFIAGGDYSPLFDRDEIRSGDIVDEKGTLLGRHRGIIHYTIGQRRGLGIASPHPLYVLNIDAERNRIVVGGKEKSFSGGLIAADLNLLAVEKLDRPYDVKGKIRIQHKAADATVFPHEDGKAKVIFRERQMSITPGQSIVLYSDDVVFGGGTIERALS